MNPLHRVHDHDALDSVAKQYQDPQIYHGVIGWNDSAEWYDIGDASNDGHTLIRVQLFHGRLHTDTPPEPGTADGIKLLCHMNALFGFRIPDKGTRCVVAIPPGMMGQPGAGIIMATIEKNPSLQYDQDRIHVNFGEDKHVVFRAKSITITDPENRYIMVGTSRAGGAPVVMCQDETGSGWMVQAGVIGMQSASGGAIKSLFQMTNEEIGLCQTDGSFLKLGSGKFIGVAKSATLNAGIVVLGSAPTGLPATAALYGVAGVAGLPSTCVFLSP